MARIVLVSRITGWHRPGGLGHVVQTRAEALANAGHDVHVLTTQGIPLGLTADASVTIHECGEKSTEYTDKFADDCLRRCKELRPDVIHLESFDRFRRWWEDLPTTVAVTLHGEDATCSFTDYRLWLHGRNAEFNFDTRRIREQINAMRGFDVVLATAIFDEWAFRDMLGMKNVQLVYNPVPDYFYENRTESTDGPAGFFALWGDSARGFENAKKACEIADVSLMHVSGIPRERLPGKYDECRCLLLPSFQSNGFDLSVAEALARGRTVITSTSGLWWLESRHCPAIKCYDPSDIQGIADAVQSDWQFPDTDFANEFRASRHAEKWLAAVA